MCKVDDFSGWQGSYGTNADESLAKLPLLTAAEWNRVLVEWNTTETEYPRNRCVHQCFELQADRTPDRTAVVFENQRLTYADLNARANQLGRYLLKAGVGPDVLVGICVERSLEMVVGLLGILKAGGAYVPLDPAYPRERLSLMLEDAEPSVLLTQNRIANSLPSSRTRVVCLDTIGGEIASESASNLHSQAKSEDLAYVIYTSGSTGKPKGVEITHRAVVNFLTSMAQRPGMTAQDCLLAVTTLSFDIAALEIFLPLIVGASLEIVSREKSSDGKRLLSKLDASDATVFQATPAMWRLLLEAGWQGKSDLKALCGGEAMPRELAQALLERVSSVWNLYGPTETTIWSTACRIASGDNPITVGRPIANTQLYILDQRLEPVAIGMTGELYIGGDGVARGYLRRPDLTAEKFIPNPIRPEDRLYRTGDLARYRPDGEIECLGRIDNQVKLRGFRIELGEIESVLGQHRGVRENVVVVREDVPGDKQLVAYVVASQVQPAGADALQDFLKQKLPEYMLPSRFVFLEALPLTPNAKVDRRALPEPGQLEFTPVQKYIGARDVLEARLVKIWESVLNIRPVGVQENFFELGGQSLLAAKLVNRIEQAFGKELSIAEIFEGPTIKQQAAMLRNANSVRAPSKMTPLQPVGRQPLFCVALDGGLPFCHLAWRLGAGQPLLHIGLTLSETRRLSRPYRMEEIATRLVSKVCELQPNGPYYVGGVCAGGLMAYEIACQLTAQGREVGLLALFEPQPPADGDRHAKTSRVDLLAQRLNFHLKNLQQLQINETSPYVRNRARTVLQKARRATWRSLYDLRSWISNGKLRNLGDILFLAARVYRPRPYDGRAALFEAYKRGAWDSPFNWTELAPQLEVYRIPGYHDSILGEPEVEILAGKLSHCLCEARSGRIEPSDHA
jgi:amino acid adenylation domain-containing protein